MREKLKQIYWFCRRGIVPAAGIVILFLCSLFMPPRPFMVTAAVLAVAEILAYAAFSRVRLRKAERSTEVLSRIVFNKLMSEDPENWFELLCSEFAEVQSRCDEFARRSLLLQLFQKLTNPYVISSNNSLHHLDDIAGSVLNFHGKYHCLCLITVQDYLEYLLQQHDGYLEFNDLEELQRIILKSFTDHFNRAFVAWEVRPGGIMVILINLRGTDDSTSAEVLDEMMDELDREAESVIRYLKDTFDIQVGAIISEPYCGLVNSQHTLEWIQELSIAFQNRNPRPALFTHRDTRAFAAQDIPINSELDRKYFLALSAHDTDEAEKLLAQICTNYRDNNSRPGQFGSMVGFRLQALRSIYEIKDPAFDMLFDQCSQTIALEDMLQNIHKIFLLTEKNERTTEAVGSKALQIREYIDEHYKDESISGTALADIFSISPSYISRVFKRDIGIGVNEYIHSLRIQEARQLLEETDLSVSEISTRVGYMTDWTLNRAFKHSVGTTPGAYRQYKRGTT